MVMMFAAACWALVWLACGAWTVGAQVAHVGDGPGMVTFQEALQNQSISQVVITKDVTIDESAWPDRPILLNRSLVIVGAAKEPNMVLLNWNFSRNRAVFAGVQPILVILKYLLMDNSRKTAGGGIDFFGGAMGNTTAEVIVENSYRLRLACTPSYMSMASLSAYPRPAHKPGSNRLQAVYGPCFRDTCYPEGVILQDSAVIVQPLDSEDLSYLGSYTLSQLNVTRLCHEVVTEDCIEKYGSADLCVSETTDRIQRSSRGQSEHSPHSLSAGSIAGIVIAAFVAVVLAAGIVLWRLRRKPTEDGGKPCPDVELGLSTGSTSSSFSPTLEYMPFTKPLLSTGGHSSARRWQVVAAYTNEAHKTASSNHQISLGVLLGAGSFGRVYKGRWCDQDVAVKVMQHNKASAGPVMNEVHLMLSFVHPNVVKGYHFLSWAAGGYTPDGCKGPDKPVDSASSVRACINRQYSGSSQVSTLLPSQPSPVLSKAGARSQQQQASLEQEGSQPNSSPTHVSGKQVETCSPIGGGATEVVTVVPEDIGGINFQPMTSSHASSSSCVSPRDFGLPSSFNEQEMESWLIQEYCDAGTLADAVHQWSADGGQFMERLLVRLREVASGMVYLHARNVLHGDLKGSNILLSSCPTSPFGQVAKVSDFGLSRALEGGRAYRRTHTLGTVTHMPPEQLRQGKMSAAADVYAFGILMWELLTGSHAFAGRHVAEVIQTVALEGKRPPIPLDTPEEYALLMQSCWAADAAERPSFDSVLICLNLMLQAMSGDVPSSPHGLSSPLVGDL